MLKQRSSEKELLDLGSQYYTIAEYQDCMKKLFQINRFFGFLRDTVTLLNRLPANTSLLDFGCGGGLFLLHLHAIFPEMQFSGIDIAPEAIRFAKALSEKQLDKSENKHNIDFRLVTQPIHLPEKSVDVIVATLVCHHLNDAELIYFLQQATACARKMVILNDLQRHLCSYLSYALISPMLFTNRIIIHDGLLSIKRGFIRKEWQSLLQQAGIQNYQINWRFPFRWQVIIHLRD